MRNLAPGTIYRELGENRARGSDVGRGMEATAAVAGDSARVYEPLGGARVALLEARMESELASLVRRHGGNPLCVPALREVERECADDAALAIDAAQNPGAIVVLATGVGLARWLAVA